MQNGVRLTGSAASNTPTASGVHQWGGGGLGRTSPGGAAHASKRAWLKCTSVFRPRSCSANTCGGWQETDQGCSETQLETFCNRSGRFYVQMLAAQHDVGGHLCGAARCQVADMCTGVCFKMVAISEVECHQLQSEISSLARSVTAPGAPPGSCRW